MRSGHDRASFFLVCGNKLLFFLENFNQIIGLSLSTFFVDLLSEASIFFIATIFYNSNERSKYSYIGLGFFCIF